MIDLLSEYGIRTEGETATILGVIVPTLRNWRTRGIGPAWVKRSRDVVYYDTDIRAYLERRRVVPANESEKRSLSPRYRGDL